MPTAALWLVGLSPAVLAVLVGNRIPVIEGGPVEWVAPPTDAATPAAWRLDLSLLYTAVTIGVLLTTAIRGAADRPPRSLHPAFRPVGTALAAACVAMYAGPLLSSLLGGHGGTGNWRLWLGPLAVAAVYLSPPVPLETLLRHLRAVMRVYTWGSLAALVIAPDWALTPNDIVNFRLPWVGSARLAGLTDHPILLGVLAAVILSLELTPLYRSRLWLLHAAAAASVLLLAQSRTAWIAAVAGLPFLYQRTAARRIHPVLSRSLAAGITACAAVLVPALTERLGRAMADREVMSLHGRTTVWDLALAAFRANPLFGYGPTLFADPASPVHLRYQHAHSQLYQTLATAGLVGAVGLVLLVAALLATATRTGRVTAGLSWSLVAITLVTCLAEAPLRSLELSPFLLLVALVLTVLLTGDRVAAGQVAADAGPATVPLPSTVPQPSAVPLPSAVPRPTALQLPTAVRLPAPVQLPAAAGEYG